MTEQRTAPRPRKSRARRERRRKIAAVVKWALIVAASLLLFAAGKSYALQDRGYSAVGGEYMLLLLPVIYFAAERTVMDWIEERDQLRGGRNR